MSILLRSKVTEIFCIADDSHKEFEKSTSEHLLKVEDFHYKLCSAENNLYTNIRKRRTKGNLPERLMHFEDKESKLYYPKLRLIGRIATMTPINAKSVQLIELHAFVHCLLSVSLSESFDLLENKHI